MIPLAPIFRKAYWSLASLGGLYALFCLAMINPTIQKHALYMHKVNTLALHDVNEPSLWGFAKRQVTPFNVSTADGVRLYAWHVLPQQVYAEHERDLLMEPEGPRGDFTTTKAYRLLRSDPEARVVVNLHGNAGHIAQGYRPQTYRALTQSSPHIHILTFDYRGFGYSTGTPSEPALVVDALSFITYVMRDLGIPADRIVLLGQSLGTAVASAATLHFADQSSSLNLFSSEVRTDEQFMGILKSFPDNVDFAATILVASFPSLKELLMTYKIGGVIPVLSPLRFYTKAIAFLQARIVDHWPTAERLAALAPIYASKDHSADRHLNLHIMHALDDQDIPWRNGALNYEAVNTAFHAVAGQTGVKVEDNEAAIVGDGFIHTLKVGDNAKIKMEAVRYGGHNSIMGSVPVALAVVRAFGLAK